MVGKWTFIGSIVAVYLMVTVGLTTASQFTRQRVTRTRQSVPHLQEKIARIAGTMASDCASAIIVIEQDTINTHKEHAEHIVSFAQMNVRLIDLIKQMADGNADCVLFSCSKQELIDIERKITELAEQVHVHTQHAKSNAPTISAKQLANKLSAILDCRKLEQPSVITKVSDNGKLQ